MLNHAGNFYSRTCGYGVSQYDGAHYSRLPAGGYVTS